MVSRFLLLAGLLTALLTHAQVNNEVFENRMDMKTADSAKLFLGLNMLGFGKNNEYSKTMVDGYTLFGYQFNPYLSYTISPHFRLDAGIYLQQDFGNDQYSQVAPTFSLKYQNRNYAFIFGTLEGSLNHRLIEPLYNFEHVLNNRLENGIQYLWIKEGLFLDAWINWQHAIYRNDPEQEQFTAGISLTKTIYKNDRFTLELPMQGLTQHRGGEIDRSTGFVSTLYNGVIGLNIHSSSAGFAKTWGVKSYLAFYSDGSPNPQQVYRDGHGVYINPYVTTHIGLTVMGSYWYAKEFISPQGGYVYPSYNEQFPFIADRYRSLFMIRLLYDIKLADHIDLTLRAEPFFDSLDNSLEYSFGFYINFYNRFFLLNAKKNN